MSAHEEPTASGASPAPASQSGGTEAAAASQANSEAATPAADQPGGGGAPAAGVPVEKQHVPAGEVRKGEGFYWFGCPWCNTTIVVPEGAMACEIFRCGTMKKTGAPIPPHAPQAQCEALAASGQIHGCGRPLRTRGKARVETCGWI